MIKVVKYVLTFAFLYIADVLIGYGLLCLAALTSWAPFGYGCGAIGEGLAFAYEYLIINIFIALASIILFYYWIGRKEKALVKIRYFLPAFISLIFSFKYCEIINIEWWFFYPINILYFIIATNILIWFVQIYDNIKKRI